MMLSDEADRPATPGSQPDPDATLETGPVVAPAPESGWPLQRDPLHFVVIALLLADIVFGLGLAVFAEKVIAFRPMAIMGCGLAALGLGILAYFVLVGGGAEKRKRRR